MVYYFVRDICNNVGSRGIACCALAIPENEVGAVTSFVSFLFRRYGDEGVIGMPYESFQQGRMINSLGPSVCNGLARLNVVGTGGIHEE